MEKGEGGGKREGGRRRGGSRREEREVEGREKEKGRKEGGKEVKENTLNPQSPYTVQTFLEVWVSAICSSYSSLQVIRTVLWL